MSPTVNTAIPPRSLYKRIFQASSVYSLTFLIPQLVSILMVPVVTRCLTRADYGITDLLQQTSSVLSILLGVGFPAAIGYFYFQAERQENRDQVVSTAILGSGLLGLLAVAVCLPFAGWLSALVFPHTQAAGYLALVIATMPVSFALEALFAWLRVVDKPAVFVAGTVVRVGVTALGTVLLVAVLRMHVWGVLATSTATTAITTLVLAAYCYRRVRLAFASSLFWRMMRFSMALGSGAIAIFFIHFGDRFFLPHYRPYAEIGLYALAYRIAMLLSAAFSSFLSYWNAQIFEILKRPDWEEVFQRLFTYSAAGLAFLGLLLVAGARPILMVMVPPAFQGAANLVPPLVLAYLLRGLGDFFRFVFLVEGHPSYDAICSWIGAGVCLAGYCLLIPRYGVWGAAWATVAAFGIMGLTAVLWVYRVRRYRLEYGRLAKVAAATAAALVIFVLVPGSTLAARIGAAAASIGTFPLMLWLTRFPSPGEWGLMRTALARVRSLVFLEKGTA